MRIEIKHINGTVLFSTDADSFIAGIEKAVKDRANLRGADLCGADLRNADLSGADLRNANLRNADLRGADLRCADLYCANLRTTDLRGADLRNADLRGADLRNANLRNADLRNANLRNADLRGAKNIRKSMSTPLVMLLDQPGAIRAYKLVTADGVGPFTGGLVYRLGETIIVNWADTDDTRECAAGIHLATLDWCMREWRPGYRILVAEFTAQDIAAIPIATDGKFRVRRCTIVGEKDLAELGLCDKAENAER